MWRGGTTCQDSYQSNFLLLFSCRLMGKSFSAISVGLSDLWKLAFSVQINPLAAVHPISAAY